MKESDDLFDLIHSMDAHEKGYFKKYTRLHGNASENNYLKLFDFLNKQEEYKEAQILQKFRGEKFIRQLAVAKHYLYDLILRSLRAYQENQSTIARFNARMENAEILFSRGMYAQAMKMIAKCRELVNELDDPVRELEIHYWDRKYIGELKASGMREQMDASFAESYASMQRLRKHLELRELFFHFLSMVRKDMSRSDHSIQAELKEIVAHPHLADENQLDGFYQKLGFYNSWNIYHYLKGNQQEAYGYMRKIIDLWNAHPAIRDQNMEVYIAGVNNYIISCTADNKLDEVRECIDLVDAMEVSNTGLKVKVFENLSLWKLSYGMNKGSNYLEAQFETLESGLEAFTGKLNEGKEMVIHFSLAMAYLVTMKYNQALKKLNYILDIKKAEVRRDVQAVARVLNLLVHYELGNDDLLEHITRSAKRYLESREQFYEYEQIIFGAMNKLIKSNNVSSGRAIFAGLKTDLENYLQRHPEKWLDTSFKVVFCWVTSKVGNISIQEAFNNSGHLGG